MRKQGFTIVELLVFMGILSVFLGVLTQVFHSALDVQLETAATASVDLTGNYLFNRLEYDIRRATGIETPSAPGQTSSSLALDIGGVDYTYSILGSSLQLANDLGSFSLTDVNTQVSNLSFTRRGSGSGNDAIEISFTLTSTATTTAGESESRQLQTSVSLR